MRPYIPYFIYDRFVARQQQGLIKATTLSIDISGFTTLTEQLMQQDKAGAEALSIVLDNIFKPVVTLVHEHKGIIPYFAGDAFVAIFENEQAAKAMMLAWQIKDSMARKGTFKTPFGAFAISLRLGLSYGYVEWGVVGEEDKAFYFKGSAIERAIKAQQAAQAQSIVFDEWFKEIYYPAENTKVNIEVLDDTYYTLTHFQFDFERSTFEDETHEEEAYSNTPSVIGALKPLEEGILSQFIPQSILNSKVRGEFRKVISIFLSFDYTQSHQDLDKVSSIVLKNFKIFGGYLKEIDFSDKGCMMVGFFGAPTAFENQNIRALSCVLSIRQEIERLQKLLPCRFRAGLTSGVGYAGVVGGKERCQYAVVGDTVNLAARMAQNAAWGSLLCDRTLSSTSQFEWRERGAMQYKGISADVAVFELISEKDNTHLLPIEEAFIGRNTELETMITSASLALSGEGVSIVCLFGEAGVGKSRLLRALHDAIQSNLKLTWATCQSDQILRKPFNPFIYFLKNYFNQNAHHAAWENQKTFDILLNELIKSLPVSAYTEGVELKRMRWVLAELVGLPQTDSPWEQLDAKGRYDNTITALTQFLTTLATVQPLVIALEDAHWLDIDSQKFINIFLQKIKHNAVWVVATLRYNDDGSKTIPFGFDPDIRLTEIELGGFTTDNLIEFARQKLRGIKNDTDISPELHELLWRSSNGNAFYAEQVIDYLYENNLLYLNNDIWSVKDNHIKVPPSVSTILTARIDRLSSVLKETIKAAAVIGREFEIPILAEVMLSNEAFVRQYGSDKVVLSEQIHTAERSHIWRALNELRYIFHHTLLHEAVYDMQLRSRLRELHELTGQAIEKLYAARLEERYLDLAFHFEKAENSEKTIFYLKKAADYARRHFQNRQALELYEKLLSYTQETTEAVKVIIRLGNIYQLIGQWDKAQAQFEEAIRRAVQYDIPSVADRAHNAYGTLLMLKGQYADAQKHLERAADLYKTHHDTQGQAMVFGNLGNLYFRQGDYETAKQYFLQSVGISHNMGLNLNAQIVANLGLTFMNTGNFTEGVLCIEDALTFCRQQNDLVGKAILSVNLGIILFEKGDNAAALQHLETGWQLSHQLGNKQLTAIALGCIGNVWLDEHNLEKATEFIEQDLSMTEELGDIQGIVIASELMGRLQILNKDTATSRVWFEKSLALSRQLKYQKGIVKALQGLAHLNAQQNNCDIALMQLKEAISICRAINNKLSLGYCLVQAIELSTSVGQDPSVEVAELAAIEAYMSSQRLSRLIQKTLSMPLIALH